MVFSRDVPGVPDAGRVKRALCITGPVQRRRDAAINSRSSGRRSFVRWFGSVGPSVGRQTVSVACGVWRASAAGAAAGGGGGVMRC